MNLFGEGGRLETRARAYLLDFVTVCFTSCVFHVFKSVSYVKKKIRSVSVIDISLVRITRAVRSIVFTIDIAIVVAVSPAMIVAI